MTATDTDVQDLRAECQARLQRIATLAHAATWAAGEAEMEPAGWSLLRHKLQAIEDDMTWLASEVLP